MKISENTNSLIRDVENVNLETKGFDKKQNKSNKNERKIETTKKDMKKFENFLKTNNLKLEIERNDKIGRDIYKIKDSNGDIVTQIPPKGMVRNLENFISDQKGILIDNKQRKET